MSFQGRRRAQKTMPPPPAPTGHLPTLTTSLPWSGTDKPTMSLRKCPTFHSPSSPSEESDPILHIPSLPRRSPTCPKALDAAVAAGERRMASLIGSFDRTLSNIGQQSPGTSPHIASEDLPLPKGMLDAALPGPSNPVPRTSRTHSRRQSREVRGHHASDSGIGSTHSGTLRATSESGQEALSFGLESTPGAPGSTNNMNAPTRTHTAITRSLSAAQPSGSKHHMLSVRASAQIQKHIINPILQKSNLKEFHPLVRDVPRRVNEREILCLRDLEKTLIFLAPGKAKSVKSYLSFCEVSIQCIHTTVDYLSDQDQRRPTDAPYSNGYFLDLVGQIRQYASEMAASRQRQAAGEKATEEDYSPSEKVVLQGGLSQTGRPAQLVRVKEGKTIPIVAGPSQSAGLYNDESSTVMKRSLSSQSEDSVHRCMARRRKLSPGEVMEEPVPQVCRTCKKEFKRPCDLTKHEKTHSRPFKCSEESCKYYTYGWPTEKERERHVNDKHSQQPSMYSCHFHPCRYQSKRESNCKQHMEKSHGWKYVKAKGKGKKVADSDADQTPQTPMLQTPVTPAMDIPTPVTDGSSPFDVNFSPNDYGQLSNAWDAGTEEVAPFSLDMTMGGPLDLGLSVPFDNLDTPFTHGYQMTAQNEGFPGPSMNQSSAFLTPENAGIASYSTVDHGIDAQIDWNSLNTDTFNAQLMTPSHSIGHRSFDSFSHREDFNVAAIPLTSPDMHIANLSPSGQPSVMLCSPQSAIDEGFDDFMPTSGKPADDFTLFSSNEGSLGSVNEGVFPDLHDFQQGFGTGQYSQGISQQYAFLNDVEMDLSPDEH